MSHYPHPHRRPRKKPVEEDELLTAETDEEDEEDEESESDLVWGGKNIAKEMNWTTAQFYHLYETGALEGCVAKLGHKTFVGSKKRLRTLPFKK